MLKEETNLNIVDIEKMNEKPLMNDKKEINFLFHQRFEQLFALKKQQKLENFNICKKRSQILKETTDDQILCQMTKQPERRFFVKAFFPKEFHHEIKPLQVADLGVSLNKGPEHVFDKGVLLGNLHAVGCAADVFVDYREIVFGNGLSVRQKGFVVAWHRAHTAGDVCVDQPNL